MKKNYVYLLLVLTIGCETKIDSGPARYNIIWDSPSKDHHGSMPIGNGNIGLNVWVEQNGDLCFYIGRTDTWGDNGRLLKIGKVRIKFNPAIIYPGVDFKQELELQTGKIKISSIGNPAGPNRKVNLLCGLMPGIRSSPSVRKARNHFR